MKLIFLIIILSISLSVYGYEFVQDYKASDFNSILEQAKNDDALSQEKVAKYYLHGIGVTQSNEKALYWFKKSANWGLTNTKKNIGDIYLKSKNYKESYKWYFLATLDNLYPAEKAMIKIENKLTKQEINDAKYSVFEWLKKNAEKGEPISQFHLGKIYRSNEIVKQDKVQALKWIMLSQSYLTLISSANPYVDNSEDLKLLEDLMNTMLQNEINQSKELVKAWVKQRKSNK